MEQNVTSIEQLLEYQRGQFVQLPEFAEGQPFFARLKRPSLLALVKSGKIPNQLVLTANKLFNGKGMDDTKETAMPEVLEILDVICEATFVEPSYRAMKEAGIELTDEQFMTVFNYTQQGVKALEPFRTEPSNNGPVKHDAEVQATSFGDTGDT